LLAASILVAAIMPEAMGGGKPQAEAAVMRPGDFSAMRNDGWSTFQFGGSILRDAAYAAP